METETVAAEPIGLKRPEVRGLAFTVGFFFSFRLCIVLLSARLFGLDPSTGTGISLGINLISFCLICYSAGAFPRSFWDIVQPRPVRWALAFLAFSGVSLLWSETASVTNSLGYWAGLLIDCTNVILLLRCDSGMEEAHSLLKGFICSACCLAAIAWAMPVAADLRLGDEEFFNPNQIGNVCAMAILFAQYLSRASRSRWLFVQSFLVITLIRSLSKTTLAAFLVAEALLLLLDGSMSRKAKTAVVAFALLLVIGFWGLFAAYLDYYMNNGNQAETLTGRVVIWLYVLGGVADHSWTPLIGHGFDSWWKVVPPFGGQLFEARHAENEVLQQLYAYGLAGIVLLVGVYGSLFKQVRKLQAGSIRAVLLALLVFIVVRGAAEAEAFDLLLPLWAVIVMSALADLHPRVLPV